MAIQGKLPSTGPAWFTMIKWSLYMLYISHQWNFGVLNMLNLIPVYQECQSVDGPINQDRLIPVSSLGILFSILPDHTISYNYTVLLYQVTVSLFSHCACVCPGCVPASENILSAVHMVVPHLMYMYQYFARRESSSQVYGWYTRFMWFRHSSNAGQLELDILECSMLIYCICVFFHHVHKLASWYTWYTSM